MAELGRHLTQIEESDERTERGLEWLRKAAEEGCLEAQVLLAEEYETGVIVSRGISKGGPITSS